MNSSLISNRDNNDLSKFYQSIIATLLPLFILYPIVHHSHELSQNSNHDLTHIPSFHEQTSINKNAFQLKTHRPLSI